MLTLGIETSCDETSVAVTDGENVLSNIVSSSVHLHKRYGGVVPEIASRFHVEYIMEVLEKALAKARCPLKKIKLVAVTNGPGLVGALLTGISVAKSISYSLHVPILGVNHILAHLNSAFLNRDDKPKFPFVGLVVSGGHTVLFFCEKTDRYKILGQTQDDAIGEAYDKVAKILGLGYPGGPVVDRMAALSTGKNRVILPKINQDKNSLDFSFSGIKTAVLYYVRNVQRETLKDRLEEGLVRDICRSFQEIALDSLVEKTFIAVKKYNAGRIVVGGGVAANSRLREKLFTMAQINGVRVHFPEMKYCMDNAAMIGSLGEKLYRKGCRSDLYLSAEPNLKA